MASSDTSAANSGGSLLANTGDAFPELKPTPTTEQANEMAEKLVAAVTLPVITKASVSDNEAALDARVLERNEGREIADLMHNGQKFNYIPASDGANLDHVIDSVVHVGVTAYDLHAVARLGEFTDNVRNPVHGMANTKAERAAGFFQGNPLLCHLTREQIFKGAKIEPRFAKTIERIYIHNVEVIMHEKSGINPPVCAAVVSRRMAPLETMALRDHNGKVVDKHTSQAFTLDMKNDADEIVNRSFNTMQLFFPSHVKETEPFIKNASKMKKNKGGVEYHVPAGGSWHFDDAAALRRRYKVERLDVTNSIYTLFVNTTEQGAETRSMYESKEAKKLDAPIFAPQETPGDIAKVIGTAENIDQYGYNISPHVTSKSPAVQYVDRRWPAIKATRNEAAEKKFCRDIQTDWECETMRALFESARDRAAISAIPLFSSDLFFRCPHVVKSATDEKEVASRFPTPAAMLFGTKHVEVARQMLECYNYEKFETLKRSYEAEQAKKKPNEKQLQALQEKMDAIPESEDITDEQVAEICRSHLVPAKSGGFFVSYPHFLKTMEKQIELMRDDQCVANVDQLGVMFVIGQPKPPTAINRASEWNGHLSLTLRLQFSIL